MKPPRIPILLIEDTPSLQFVYRSVLTAAGMEVHAAGSATEALQLFHTHRPGVVVLDLLLPDRDGLTLMSEMLAINPEICLVVMSAQGSVDRAVTAMRAGAFDFLLKPFEENRFLGAVRAALEAASQVVPGSDAARLPTRRRPGPASAEEPVASIGGSEAMKQVHQMIASVARSIATVFITGESGTGKELAAQALHAQSGRSRGPLIALNCGAIPHDLLESEVFGHMKGSFTGAIADKPGAAAAADGGTLFLDEVCEMAPALQTKLLRFLQTSMVQPLGATRPRKVDVRIVCATNQDPLEAVRRGQFREDLYYRLHVVPLHLPPLRERGRDAVEIAEVALRRFAIEEGKTFSGLAPETQRILLRQRWPGNVRQLLNVIRNVVVLQPGGLVTPDMLPAGLSPEHGPDLPGAAFGKGETDHDIRGLSAPASAGFGPPPGAPHGSPAMAAEHDPHPAAIAPPAANIASAPADDPFVGQTLAMIERRAIEAALSRHGGAVPKAAHDLGISVSTLYRRIEAWRSALQS